MSTTPIAIVGAGPAGQALALALADDGYAVALIDAGPGPAPEPSAADLRVFALSPASTRLLRGLQVWPPVLADRVCAYRHMSIWQRDPDHGLHFDAAALGWPELGHIVEHNVLQYTLAQRIAAMPTVHCHWRSRVEAIEAVADAVDVQLSDGRHVRASLVVGADGAGSPVRDLAGIQVERSDYGQRGLVANIHSAVGHEQTARQRFLATGPLAFLPLADGGCSIVWSLPTTEAERLQALPAAEFEHELNRASGGVLGRLSLVSERVLFPLARALVERYHAGRVVLVGDAAHVVHPLAGQGLNLGFLDCAALAEVLAQARRRQLDPGNAAVLGRYARWRQGDNALAARAFEALDRYYKLATPGMAGLREAGHRLLEQLPVLKRRFVAHASGLAGRVPARCQSVAT